MVFGEAYATLYDSFYREKDYGAECNLIEHAWQRCGARPRRVLDLGCGTGGHAVELARRGLAVTGVDLSSHMLDAARRKAVNGGVDIDLQQADITAMDLGSTFEAAISMFAVIGYLTTNRQLDEAFATVRRHLEPGGVFVFDCWYGPAVLEARPEIRVHEHVVGEGERILRLVNPELDTRHHVVTVRYQVMHLEGDRLLSEAREAHRMRFLFPLELESLLNRAGFDSVDLFPFGAFDRPPGSGDWNVFVVAR